MIMNIPITERGKFTWEGKTYLFNAKVCYDGEGLVKLPNGILLHVESWTDLIPLTPGKIVQVCPQLAILLLENNYE